MRTCNSIECPPRLPATTLLHAEASPEYVKIAAKLKKMGHDITQGDAIGVVFTDTEMLLYVFH
jgi:hypothetical protein